MFQKVLQSFALLALLGVAAAQARSGCCSSHGGVCGCFCCDGTPLSVVCFDPNCGLPHQPLPPSRLTAATPSPTSVVLSWADNSTDEIGFRIESRQASESAFHEVIVVSANVTSYQVLGLAPATTYVFRVSALALTATSDFSNELTVKTSVAPVVCSPGSTTLCLGSGRFQVEASYKTSQGQTGMAHVMPLTSDTGYLWFFSSSNVEVVVKVLDGCAFGGHYWVFAGGLTDVFTVLTVMDLNSGATQTYTNPQGKAFLPIQDTSAFATCP